MRGIHRDAMYGPDSVSSRVISESVLLLGGPRALLLQLAHPKVAAGVAEHSDFKADPFGRLRRTLDAMYTIAFRSPTAAERTLAALRRVHGQVTGTLGDGEDYAANDPELLHWVHATLVDTVLAVEQRYLGLLDPEERAQYYRESKRMAAAFGIPEGLVPIDLRTFREYMDQRFRTLEVSDTARDLSRAIVHPRVPLVPGVVWEPIRLVTIDLLPRPLREGYGLAWDAPRKGLVRFSQAGSRLVLPRIPRPIRNFPNTARRLAQMAQAA